MIQLDTIRYQTQDNEQRAELVLRRFYLGKGGSATNGLDFGRGLEKVVVEEVFAVEVNGGDLLLSPRSEVPPSSEDNVVHYN